MSRKKARKTRGRSNKVLLRVQQFRITEIELDTENNLCKGSREAGLNKMRAA